MKKIIIRTPDGQPLEKEVEQKIKQQAELSTDEEVEITYQSSFDQELFLHSYSERINGVTKAAHMLVDILSQDVELGKHIPEGFSKRLDELNQHYLNKLVKNRNSDNINSYQKILSEYLKRLEYIFESKLNLKDKSFFEKLSDSMRKLLSNTDEVSNADKKDQSLFDELGSLSVRKLLSKADEYVVLKEGRPLLVTVTKDELNNRDGDNYLIQLELPQDPLSDEMKQEFAKAKDPNIPLENKPDWFKRLTLAERKLFELALKEQEGDTVHLDAISSKHRTIPGVAHFSKHKTVIINKKGEIKKTYPSRLRSSMIASRDLPIKERELRDKYASHNLQKIIKSELENKLKSVEITEDEIENIPILVQTLISPLPLPKVIARAINPDNDLYDDKQRAINDLVKNGIEIKLANGSTKRIFPKNVINTNHPLNSARYLRPIVGKFGSYPGSPSAIEGYKLIKAAQTYLNKYSVKQKEVNEQFDKLNSRKDIDTLENMDSMDIDNSPALTEKYKEMIEELEETEKKIRIYEKQLQIIPPENSEITKNNLLARLQVINESIDYRKSLIKEASEDLQNLIDAPSRGFLSPLNPDNNRELFLSSLEEVTTSHMNGMSYGSCVSGKDRKSLEAIHTDAMLRYYDEYKTLPKYYDTSKNRENFVKIYAEIYVSRHHQTNAGQNAPGSNGIKTPDRYLPVDIQKAISEKYKKHEMNYSNNVLKDSNRLASNNEVDKVIKKAPKLSKEQKDKYDKSYEEFIETRPEHPSISASLASHDHELDEIEEKKLVVLLKNIISDKHWDKLGIARAIPTGIKEMRYILNKYPEKAYDLKLITAFAGIAEERLIANPNKKHPDTYAFYKMLVKLRDITIDQKEPLTVKQLHQSIPYIKLSNLNQRFEQEALEKQQAKANKGMAVEQAVVKPQIPVAEEKSDDTRQFKI